MEILVPPPGWRIVMKTIFKLGLVAAILITCNTGAVRAASLVKVSLWDKGASTEMPIGLVYATPGLDMTKATIWA
jgi:uncharacterized cupredoxin-like copper-binding protein